MKLGISIYIFCIILTNIHQKQGHFVQEVYLSTLVRLVIVPRQLLTLKKIWSKSFHFGQKKKMSNVDVFGTKTKSIQISIAIEH